MKFLLELVPCCGSRNSSGKDSIGDGGSSNSSRRSEETRSLMAQRAIQTLVAKRCRRKNNNYKKRGRVGATSPASSGGMADWHPTLSSISEDNVAVVAEKRTERAVNRKGGSTGSVGSGGGSRDEDRRNHFTMIPTFSPTPFMI